ncbi:hypothetical protein, partial [Sphingomonas sp. GM_Shp_1]|uniref:hypothetical protein n=1 Tax=Sphingomonas sp. GM_Shp_1 TaxID=2937381 RepID=UPI00226B8F9D
MLDAVRGRLSRDFSGYVVRGVAAPTRRNGLAVYDSDEIAKVLGQAADGVFGSSRRPVGFCRNAQRGCSKTGAGRKCDKAGHQACALEQPRRLFLVYQEGSNEAELLKTFAHAALPLRIPRSVYGQRQHTADRCAEAIRTLNARAAVIEPVLKPGSALLLPPRIFGQHNAVTNLLDRVVAGKNPVRELRDFRQLHWDKAERAFVGRSRLGFSPGHDAGLHGEPHDHADIAVALTRRYRLGCVYDGAFHWDVSPMDGSHLAEKYEFK